MATRHHHISMITAGLFIFAIEGLQIRRLFLKYGLSVMDDGIEAFIAQARPDDIYLSICHAKMMGFGLGLATMGRLFQ